MVYYCSLTLKDHPDLRPNPEEIVVVFDLPETPDTGERDRTRLAIADALRFVKERLDRFRGATVVHIEVGHFCIGVVARNGYVTTNRHIGFWHWDPSSTRTLDAEMEAYQ